MVWQFFPKAVEKKPEIDTLQKIVDLFYTLPSLSAHASAYIEKKQLETYTLEDYVVLFLQILVVLTLLLIVYHSLSAIKSAVSWVYRSIASVIWVAIKWSSVLVVIYAVLVNKWWTGLAKLFDT